MHHVRLLIVPFSFVFLKGWNSLRGRNVRTAFALVLICCNNITRIAIALDVRHYLQHRYRCLTWLQISHQVEFNNCVLGMKMLKLQAKTRLKRQDPG